MRLVIQRISKGKVSVENKAVSEASKGYFILVGVGQQDSEYEANFLAQKVTKLRIMQDESGKMNLTLKDADGEALVVSQFTLYADTKDGNRPSFIKAARPEKARLVYDHFVEKLKSYGIKTKTGKFGEYMKIEVVLDSPVTIVMGSSS